ncbi:transposable element Tcb1 transposase [Trichonephila clavipes]|nr:transposable element Tcb1 transposase [Trichonephila clavipes]
MFFYVVELLDDWNVAGSIPGTWNRPSSASPGFGNDSKMMLSSATGTTVSKQTVYRRLGHIGLYARRTVRCVPLTATCGYPGVESMHCVESACATVGLCDVFR